MNIIRVSNNINGSITKVNEIYVNLVTEFLSIHRLGENVSKPFSEMEDLFMGIDNHILYSGLGRRLV